MCTVSMIHDWAQTIPTPVWTPPMFDGYQELIEKIEKIDEKLGETDCGMERKQQFIDELRPLIDAQRATIAAQQREIELLRETQLLQDKIAEQQREIDMLRNKIAEQQREIDMLRNNPLRIATLPSIWPAIGGGPLNPSPGGTCIGIGPPSPSTGWGGAVSPATGIVDALDATVGHLQSNDLSYKAEALQELGHLRCSLQPKKSPEDFRTMSERITVADSTSEDVDAVHE